MPCAGKRNPLGTKKAPPERGKREETPPSQDAFGEVWFHRRAQKKPRLGRRGPRIERASGRTKTPAHRRAYSPTIAAQPERCGNSQKQNGRGHRPARPGALSFRPEKRGRPEPPEAGAKFNPMLASPCTERYWPFPIQTHRAVQPGGEEETDGLATARPGAQIYVQRWEGR